MMHSIGGVKARELEVFDWSLFSYRCESGDVQEGMEMQRLKSEGV